MTPFIPTLAEIKQILAEVNKFYILVERNPTEDPPPALVVEMRQYADNLNDILRLRYGLLIPNQEALELFKDALRITTEENPNYIPLTHHELKPGEIFYIGKPKYVGKFPTEREIVMCKKEET